MSPTPPLRLDVSVCDRCGGCVEVCKPRALRIGPGYISVDWEKCTGCAKCADVCGRRAIMVRGSDGADLPPRVVPFEPVVTAADVVGKVAAPLPQPAAASAPVGSIAWTLPEAALALVAAFTLLVGVQAVPGGFASAPVWAGITLLVYDVLLGCLLWFLARRRGSTIGAAYRLDVAPGSRAGLSTVGVAVGCWLFSVAYRAVAIGLGATPPASAGVDLTRMFGSGALGVVGTIALVAVVGPLLEELLLRGVVLGAVTSRFGVWPAILACALAFAMLHASLWSLLPLTVLGVGLGWLAVRSRSLWPAVVAHVLYNAVLVAAAFYAAG
jgi:membrane protease YdiL (CAAX protease family)/NAD-dependent dihydropyrimidine dehydrogenase PreA subunit